MRDFYERVLPSQGIYCVTGINENGALNLFASSLDELVDHVIRLLESEANIFIAPGSFLNHSRRADNSAFVRSFFVDLDVGEGKGYQSQEEALILLGLFCDQTGLPPPVRVNSGSGIHAYWIFDQDVPAAEWKPYAKKFKSFCLDNGLRIDPVVTADAARIMRCPETFNYKTSPPLSTSLIDEVVHIYSWELFKEFLGEVEPDVLDILKSVPRGLDDDTKKMLKHANFETTFQSIAERSLEGDGCAQIKYILTNAETLLEPLWYAGLSIARHCDDWETAIHLMSEDHPEYSHDNTVRKAEQTVGKPQGCSVFDSLNPGVCAGCPHRGHITNPLAIGRRLRQHVEEETSQTATQGADPFKSANAPSQTHQPLPKALFPYLRGVVDGGIYYVPPPEVGKDGKKSQDDPILLTPHDIYPIKRMFSAADGECLMMRVTLPHDEAREFLLPMKDLYLPDRFKEGLAKKGVLFANSPQVAHLLMNYVIKWGQYLINADSAEQMRMQMGWTENRDAFVVGNTEIRRDGRVVQTASSPFVRGISKLLRPYGSYATWQSSANALNMAHFELYAFGLMTGFGSPLMHITSTSGANLAFCGESGCGKTGSLYGAVSVWGQPKDLCVFDATDNGMIGRYLGLKNMPLGCDEVSNKRPDQLSNLIHRVSHGKGKIRMQASVNAERELEMSASLINFLTTNQSLYDKLTDLKANPDGEVARLIEFAVTKPLPMLEEPSLGKRIFDPFNTNYGFAGHEFIKHFFTVGDDYVKDLVNKWSDRFIKDFGGDTAYRFYENMVAATFAGGELANEAKIISYDLDRIYNVVVTAMISIKNHAAQVNYRDYAGLVSQYVHRHQADILIMNGERVTSDPRNQLLARSEIQTGMLYVPKSEFKKFLSELQISSREFEHAMEKEGILVFNSKKRLTTGWKAGMNFAPVTSYGFKFDLPNDILKPGKH